MRPMHVYLIWIAGTYLLGASALGRTADGETADRIDELNNRIFAMEQEMADLRERIGELTLLLQELVETDNAEARDGVGDEVEEAALTLRPHGERDWCFAVEVITPVDTSGMLKEAVEMRAAARELRDRSNRRGPGGKEYTQAEKNQMRNDASRLEREANQIERQSRRERFTVIGRDFDGRRVVCLSGPEAAPRLRRLRIGQVVVVTGKQVAATPEQIELEFGALIEPRR